MRSALILFLALVPPLIAATWTMHQMRRAEKELDGLTGFEGMHFED